MKLRRIALLLFVFVVFFSGCDNKLTNPTPPSQEQGTLTSLKGKISNWKYGSGCTVSLVVGRNDFLVAEAPITDGSFSLELQNVPSSDLAPVREDLPRTVTCSNDKAKIVGEDDLTVRDEKGNHVGSVIFQPVNSEGSIFVYVDTDVTLTGTDSSEGLVFDAALKKGWNIAVAKRIDSTYVKITVDNSLEGTWHFEE
jgi:hypothetical protein